MELVEVIMLIGQKDLDAIKRTFVQLGEVVDDPLGALGRSIACCSFLWLPKSVLSLCRI